MLAVKHFLDVAQGKAPADLVLKGAKLANVFSLEYEKADVAIQDGKIAGIGTGYRGKHEEDLSGTLLVPGFFDAHCHIESTLLTPAPFSELAALHGTTAIAADPHEIANTCGLAGVDFMWRESLECPLDMFFTAPSCVPASSFETPYEPLDASAIVEMFDRGWCKSLGEVMNYPAVIEGDPQVWQKIFASRTYIKSGHAPGLVGKALCAYVSSGCDSDHETVTLEEGREKLKRGMWLMIREGATEHNLETLAPLILENETRSSRCMFVSDDLTAAYLKKRGHMDEKIRLAARSGISPLTALRMTTLTPAAYFGYRNRGALAPGYVADIVSVDNLESCRVRHVWKSGRPVVIDGRLTKGPIPRTDFGTLSFRRKRISLPPEGSFRIQAKAGQDIRVIGLKPGQVVTDHLAMKPSVRDGCLCADPSRDLAMLCVLEKNQGTGRLAIGFVKGLGLRQGALGSSFAHDAHNFIVAGMDTTSIRTALSFLIETGGGLAACRNEKVLASLPLPVGGLMNPGQADEVISGLDHVEKAASGLGTTLEHPFMAMSFLCLSVIPDLKLTDRGYVDLVRGGLQSLFVDSASR
ncbi:MAG: adenine deaminase [Thermovirgaceae bacterium]